MLSRPHEGQRSGGCASFIGRLARRTDVFSEAVSGLRCRLVCFSEIIEFCENSHVKQVEGTDFFGRSRIVNDATTPLYIYIFFFKVRRYNKGTPSFLKWAHGSVASWF